MNYSNAAGLNLAEQILDGAVFPRKKLIRSFPYLGTPALFVFFSDDGRNTIVLSTPP